MQVTWTVQVSRIPGNRQVCRSEEEAARLVLELLLAGVKRHQIIVDGLRQERADMGWIWKALDV